MTNRPLRDIDTADRMDRLKLYAWLGPALFVILTMAEYKAVGLSWKLIPLMIANVLLTWVIGAILFRGMAWSARGWVNMVTGAGNIAPAPSFSLQESMIMRRRYTEAAESFREHLRARPTDHDARLALAALYARHLENPAAAEELYRKVRQGQPTPRQEATAWNQLLDLYRQTGQDGRLMVELAKYADRYRGTRAGTAAKQALAEMKDHERGNGDA